LSTVIHQFHDLDRALAELRRVVGGGGGGGRGGGRGAPPPPPPAPPVALFGHVPGAERVAATFPDTAATARAFATAGFGVSRHVDVTEGWRVEVAAWVERVRAMRHVDSWLRPFTDEERARARARGGGTHRRRAHRARPAGRAPPARDRGVISPRGGQRRSA
jgi:hypothetical protein